MYLPFRKHIRWRNERIAMGEEKPSYHKCHKPQFCFEALLCLFLVMWLWISSFTGCTIRGSDWGIPQKGKCEISACNSVHLVGMCWMDKVTNGIEHLSLESVQCSTKLTKQRCRDGGGGDGRYWGKARWLESRTRWEMLLLKFWGYKSWMLLCIYTDAVVCNVTNK